MNLIQRAARPEFLPYGDPTWIHEHGLYFIQNAGLSHCIMHSLKGHQRFELRNGDRWSQDDPMSDRGRSEVSHDAILAYASDWFIRWKFMLTAELLARDQNICMQVHGDDALGSRGPIFSLNVARDVGDGVKLYVRTAEDKVGATPWKYVDRAAIDFELGAQYEFAARMRFSTTNEMTGELDFFVRKNGGAWVQVLELRNIAFGYIGDAKAYIKWGLYCRPFDMLEKVVAYYEVIGPTQTNLLPIVA